MKKISYTLPLTLLFIGLSILLFTKNNNLDLLALLIITISFFNFTHQIIKKQRVNTKIKTVKDCYRIVNDSYLGYEVQVKRWFFPFFWFEKAKHINSNTFSSIDEAKEWIKKGCPKDVKELNVFWKNCC